MARFGIRLRVLYCGCPNTLVAKTVESGLQEEGTEQGGTAEVRRKSRFPSDGSRDYSTYWGIDAGVNPATDWPWAARAKEVASTNVRPLSIFSSALESPTSFSTTVAVHVPTPQLWSDECPHLYIVCVSLVALVGTQDAYCVERKTSPTVHSRDQMFETLQCEAVQVGFRAVRIRGGELLMNHRKIMIKGANRHEHHPLLGKTLTTRSLVDDVMLLKQYNFNAVRTAHYPNDPRFYALCDVLGLYVVDEANIETHGDVPLGWSILLSILTFRIPPFPLNRLANDPDWRLPWLLRIYRMIFRDGSHPSVILWSLGNEAGAGQWPREAKRWIDSTVRGKASNARDYRPVQYEPGGSPPDCSDICCPMYPPVEDVIHYAVESSTVAFTPRRHTAWFHRLCRICRRRNRSHTPSCCRHRGKRPMILCEYQHAMGNSNGSLSDYWEAFEKFSYLQGGFIWDWADQGLLRSAVQSTSGVKTTAEHNKLLPASGFLQYWGYGGDFGDRPNDRNFNINGLLYPDRRLKPALVEAKFVHQPVHVTLESVTFAPLDPFSDETPRSPYVYCRCYWTLIGALC